MKDTLPDDLVKNNHKITFSYFPSEIVPDYYFL